MKLSIKISLLIIGLTFLIGIASIFVTQWLLQKRMNEMQFEWVNTLVYSLTDSVSLYTINGDKLNAREQLKNIIEKDLALEYAFLLDFEGQIFAHTFDRGFPRFLLKKIQSTPKDIETFTYINHAGNQIFDVSSPLINGMEARLHLGINQNEIISYIKESNRDLFLVILFIALIGASIGLLAGQKISKPLSIVTKWIADYGKGNKQEAPSFKYQDPDVVKLFSTFSQMIKDRNTLEENRRLSEMRYKSLFNEARDLIHLVGPDNKFIDVNAIELEKLGYSKKEFLNINLMDIIHPDYQHKANLINDKVFQGNIQEAHELLFIDKNGKEIIVEATSTPHIENNKVLYARSIMRDITDKRNTEKALIQSEAQFGRYFSLSADMLCIANHEGYFTELNPTWEKVLGFTEDELKEKPYIELVHSNDVANTVNESKRLKNNPSETINFVNRFKTKQGEYKWLSWNATTNPETNQIYAVAHDITNIKHTQEELVKHQDNLEQLVSTRSLALKESEARLAHLLTSSPVVIYTLEVSDQLLPTFVSDNIENIFGYNKDNCLSEDNWWANHLHPDDAEQIFSDLENLFKFGHHEHEYRFLMPDGEYVWLHDELKLLYDNNGKPSEVIGYWANVNDRKKYEAQVIEAKELAENANQAKSEFLSSMSHELRTPMNAILGFAQLMEMDETDELARQNIQEILNAGNHLLELINDVLDLAKVESGNIELSLEVISVGEVIEECLKVVESIASKRDILLIDNSLSYEGYHVSADYTRLKQVMLNLLSNAIKYNKEGGSVSLSCEKINNERIRISVGDTGMGLSKEQQKHLFKPFNRVGRENSTIEGTGIGLVITKQLIEAMGGEIGLISIADQGSTFWFELNAVQGAEKVADEPVNVGASGSSIDKETPSKIILYIEDNPANLKLVQKIIRDKTQHKLISATTGIDGLDLATKNKPDIILLDINLPGMDGYEVIKKLRENQNTKSIPVLGLSANAMPSDIEKAESSGFNDYLTKPIQIHSLLNKLQKIA